MYQNNKKTDFKQQKLPKNQYISIMNNVYYCKNLYVCIWFTFARFRRSAAQRLVGIYSYTAYALQRAAPLQQNASILLGFSGCEFYKYSNNNKKTKGIIPFTFTH